MGKITNGTQTRVKRRMKSLFNTIVTQQKCKKDSMSDVRIVDVIDLDLSSTHRYAGMKDDDHPDWALDYRTSDEDETDTEDQVQIIREDHPIRKQDEYDVNSSRWGSKIPNQRVIMLTVIFVSLILGVITGAQYQYGNAVAIKSTYAPMNMATEVDVTNAIQGYGEDPFEQQLEHQNMMTDVDLEKGRRRSLRIEDIDFDHT